MQFVMIAGIGIIVHPGMELAGVHHHRAPALAQRNLLRIDDLDAHAGVAGSRGGCRGSVVMHYCVRAWMYRRMFMLPVHPA